MRIVDALAEGRARLADADIASARLDAELLLAHALGISREELLLRGGETLDAAAAVRVRAALERRAQHVPMAHLLGVREFFSHAFEVTPDTLVPRPDSETVVTAALARLPDAETPWRLLDLGTGSGCLLLSLLAARPLAHGVGTDISQAALAVARRNAAALGLETRVAFHAGDWFAALPAETPPFDCILANPPYIPSGEIAHLMPEVAEHEPRRALDGGPDGLEAYRRILRDAARHLRPGGWLVLEIGCDQAEAVTAALATAGFADLATVRDLGHRPRVVAGRRPLRARNRKKLGISRATG